MIGGKWLGLYILGGFEVAGDLEINHLHVGVNRAHQLPYARGVLFVSGTSLTLKEGRRSQVWNLLRVS